VTACPLPRKMRCSPTINVDRFKPFRARVGSAPAPGPVSDVGQEGEHEVGLRINRREIRGVTRCLVRWRGHTSADDEWLRREELRHCQEKVAEYDAALPAGPIPRQCRRPAPLPPLLRPLRRRPSYHLRGSGWRPHQRSCRRPDGAIPLAGGWPGPRYCGGPQPDRRVLARGAVRPRIRSRIGGGALAAPRGLARPGRPMGAPPSHCALVWLPFRETTVMGLPGPGRMGRGDHGRAGGHGDLDRTI
jgi:hypothetical protein